MGVTTIDIEEDLLDLARALLGTTTANATVHEALRELVAQRRQAAALDLLAGLDLDPVPVTLDP